MKIKEILKDRKGQAKVLFDIFIGIHIFVGLCWYATWFWDLIFSL